MLYSLAMRLIHVVFIGLGLAACGTDEESDTPPDPVARATWYQDVAPILANRCMTCHQDGGIAPFTLTEYESAVENSARMTHEIERGAMPPFDAREEADCTPRFGWVDDPRLTTLEVTEPAKRKGGVIVADVKELINKLRTEAKVF